jgi:hypothetical protein
LNPKVLKGQWEPEEDLLIFQLYSNLGSHWSTISISFPHRTENSIKNRFYSTLRRIALEKAKENGDTDCKSLKKKVNLEALLSYVPLALQEKAKLCLQRGQTYFFECQTPNEVETKEDSFKIVPQFSNSNLVIEDKITAESDKFYQPCEIFEEIVDVQEENLITFSNENVDNFWCSDFFEENSIFFNNQSEQI